MYLKAFQLGANAGVINYALGVNSFAAGKNADAAKYLNFAKQADKAAYGDRVDALLKRIPRRPSRPASGFSGTGAAASASPPPSPLSTPRRLRSLCIGGSP